MDSKMVAFHRETIPNLRFNHSQNILSYAFLRSTTFKHKKTPGYHDRVDTNQVKTKSQAKKAEINRMRDKTGREKKNQNKNHVTMYKP